MAPAKARAGEPKRERDLTKRIDDLNERVAALEKQQHLVEENSTTSMTQKK
jgi:hypothetical protein